MNELGGTPASGKGQDAPRTDASDDELETAPLICPGAYGDDPLIEHVPDDWGRCIWCKAHLEHEQLELGL